ncbi:12856_t:CDS:2, partial [Ambispora gerdemannii]
MNTFNKAVGLALFLAICLIASSDAMPMPYPYWPYWGWPNENTYQSNNQYASANGGNGVAQAELAQCYFFGYGTEINRHEAFRWYEKSAVCGNTQGQVCLADCYLNGSGTERDLRAAFAWYKVASDAGNAFGKNSVGMLYAKGEGVEQDYRKALYYFKQAASIADECQMSDAMIPFDTAMCYQFGRGTMCDVHTSLLWHRKAYERRNKYSLRQLDVRSDLVKFEKDLNLLCIKREGECDLNLTRTFFEIVQNDCQVELKNKSKSDVLSQVDDGSEDYDVFKFIEYLYTALPEREAYCSKSNEGYGIIDVRKQLANFTSTLALSNEIAAFIDFSPPNARFNTFDPSVKPQPGFSPPHTTRTLPDVIMCSESYTTIADIWINYPNKISLSQNNSTSLLSLAYKESLSAVQGNLTQRCGIVPVGDPKKRGGDNNGTDGTIAHIS